MRKVFLDDLPHQQGFGANQNKLIIDWRKSIGYKVFFIYDNVQGNIIIKNYLSKGQYVFVEYLDNKSFKIKAGGLCKCELGNLINKYNYNFQFKISYTIKDNIRNLTITDRIYRTHSQKYLERWYKYHCNICGYDGEISEISILNGSGCSCCCVSPKHIKIGFNDMWTTNPELAKLLADSDDGYKYTQCSQKKADWKCLICGSVIKNKRISDIHNQGLFCPKCSDGISYPEKLMYNLLKQLNVEFEYQRKFDWCTYKLDEKQKYGIYDFYIPSKQLIIEMDGSLGHGNYNKLTKQSKEESLYIDCIKDELARKHDINIIRIDSQQSNLEYIKNNILNSKLNKVLNLNIDWNLVNKNSQKTLVKCACDLKYNDENLTTLQIGKIINLSRVTIQKYLKLGNKLGWCIYNPNEEKNKSLELKALQKSKPVKLLKNDKFLGVFKSIVALSNNSETLYGVHLGKTSISQTCNKKQKTCKGFKCEFVSKEKYEKYLKEMIRKEEIVA